MNLVILDSGHAKNTAGKVAPDKSLYEWDFNNKMQYLLKKRLEDYKFKVCLTNPTPEKTSDIPLSTRANKANEFYKSNGKPKTIMLSLHANAYGEWTTARGVEVFHASNASQNSKNLAKYLCDQIYSDAKAKDSGFKNRGVKCEDYTVIYKTITTTCLIEYAFYTNRDDLKLLKNEKDMFVESTVKAICKYFGITYKAPSLEIKDGWVKYYKGWAYRKNGQWLYGWQKLGDKWCYFDSEGYAAIGWKKIDNKWYYFDKKCYMQMGWLKDKDKWYYLNEDGSMAIGWKKIDNKWYYLKEDGSMAIGWLEVKGKKYYLHTNGIMENDHIDLDDKCYHFADSGELIKVINM